MKFKKRLLVLFMGIVSFSLYAKTVKVGYYMDSGNFMSGKSEADPKYGFAYEYLQNIASYTGWTYEYRYGFFDELYNALINGEIDILTDISYTPERSKLMYFSDYPMGSETYYLYGHFDDKSISADDLSTINGKTLALGEGSFQYDMFLDWMKLHDVKPDITVMNYDDVLEEDFNNGLYDLFLSIDLVSEIKWEPIAKVGSSDIYVAVNHNRLDLIQELNTAQNALYLSNPYYNANLWATYFSNSTMSKRLSPKEKLWLKNHPVLRIGYLEDNVPYSYLGKKGEMDGLLAFLMSKMKEIFEIPDLEIQYYSYKSLNQVEDSLHAGEIDIAFPLSYDLYIAEQHNEILSRKINSTSLSFVRNRKISNIDEATSVGVAGGERSISFLKSIDAFKDKELVSYDTPESCMDAVLNGEVSGAIIGSSMIQSTYFPRKKYRKLVVSDLYEELPLCFVLNKSDTDLLSMLNKLLCVTTETEIQNELINHSVTTRKNTLREFINDYIHLILFLCIVFIILATALIFAIGKILVLINYDFLTKLLNRRAVDSRLKDFYHKAVTKGQVFSTVIFDLDYFKKVNDTYGHDCGDIVLKNISEIIKNNLRKGDKAFRWGGEEFLVLINGDKKIAIEYAEKIRKIIEEKSIIYNNTEIHMTITAGVSTFTPDSTEISIFLAADNNLYKGKESGRNKVVSD